MTRVKIMPVRKGSLYHSSTCSWVNSLRPGDVYYQAYIQHKRFGFWVTRTHADGLTLDDAEINVYRERDRQHANKARLAQKAVIR